MLKPAQVRDGLDQGHVGRAAEEGVAAGDAFRLEPHHLVSAARAHVLGEYAEQPRQALVSLKMTSTTCVSSARPCPCPGRDTAMRLIKVTRSGAAQSRSITKPTGLLPSRPRK